MVNAVTTVHTTGINWESVLTIVGAVCVILTTLGTYVARYVAGNVTTAINNFKIDVVAKLDTRLTTVETKLDEKNLRLDHVESKLDLLASNSAASFKRAERDHLRFCAARTTMGKCWR